MKTMKQSIVCALCAFGIASAPAMAAGELNLYNWTDYTSPDLIKKFEEETGVKVVLDTYDSNETLLAKLKSGGGNYDIVVPSHNFVPVLIEDGLLQAIDAPSLSTFGNLDSQWRDPPWDKGNRYTVPWQLGTTSFAVNTARFGGDINTYKVLFEPPSELQGQIGMFNAPDDIIPMALIYLGYPLCNEDAAQMKEVRNLLLQQKPHVKVYNSDGIKDRLVAEEVLAHQIWNGYAMRSREEKPELKYAYPREGVITWLDSLAVPKGAKNPENARLFIEFFMRPKNAALQSNFAGYANAIGSSLEYLDADKKVAPEFNIPSGVKTVFAENCSQKAIELQDRVWTALKK